MACSGHNVNDESAPSRAELLTSNSSCLAVQEGAVAAGEAIQHNPLLDEAGKRTPCCPQRLSVWNKELWGADIEVRHTVREGLSLVSLKKKFRTKPPVRDATPLIRKLLTTHHCLTSVDIDVNNFRGSEAHLCDALRGNRFLRFVKIKDSTFAIDADWLTLLSSVITTLVNLKELECSASCMCPELFRVALAKLLRMPTNLTALRIPELRMNGDGADIFLTALTTNSTLEELCINAAAISEARAEHRESIVKFLANTRTLKKLAVGGHAEVGSHSLKWVLKGLLWNTTITEVTFHDFYVDADCAEITAEVIARNRTMRIFNISIFESGREYTVMCRKAYYSKWLSALACNETLEAVSFSRQVGDPEQWEVLFQSLSARASPLRLTISETQLDPHMGCSWESFCGAAQRSGAEDHVHFATTLVIRDGHDMLRSKGFSKFYVFCNPDNLQMLSRMFRQLPSFTHVTIAHLEVPGSGLDEKLSSEIGHYIAATSALKELHLGMWLRNDFSVATDADIEASWAIIVESLRKNTSVRELHVHTSYATKPEARLLADAVKSSGNIHGAHVNIKAFEGAAVYVHRLRDGIEGNYILLRASVNEYVLLDSSICEEWFVIWDVTRRNSDLVARAAEFINGALVDRWGLEALEHIAEHPPPLQEVAQQLSLTDAEVAAMVRTKLKSTESLDEFMRTTGVVKDCVSCEMRKDGRVQLDDLNEDCWSLVRRYLKVRDVRDPTAVGQTEDPLKCSCGSD
ncbi:uncharacterized protein LOC142767062 [Rhipicephalus microplus]|uniref:uncharacterized protein LOC142767062 n=1 Tax=Rhipicephalus microplus TaxID=6941 RepID=UPI003F6B3931